MPVRVRKRNAREGGKAYKIVEIGTGEVKGEADTRIKASASARVRNAVDAEKRKNPGRP